ncbi:sensor histidine kinase [Costertonia aggregata]|nr:histidine kinase [Costertonia aggregata]
MKCLSDYLWQTLVPIVFFSFLWMLYRYLKKQEELEIVTKENIEMELQFLKSQINPHVLFNNLNTIYSYALEKPDAVPEMILMLSNNLKHVLYESNSHTVSLEKELEYIENYIAFQKIRTENIKEIEYRLRTDTTAHEIAPLLLITLLENAFKHSAPKSTIKIDITVKNSFLECFCSNIIYRNVLETKKEKIGLQNLKKRLSLLYKNKHALKITQTDSFEVYLKLHLK